MKTNPFVSLTKSRKFWMAMLDLLVSTTLHFGAKYLAPAAYEDIQFLIASIQPVFLLVIGSIAYEDGAKAKAAATVQVANVAAGAAVQVAQAETATARADLATAKVEATGNSNLG